MTRMHWSWLWWAVGGCGVAALTAAWFLWPKPESPAEPQVPARSATFAEDVAPIVFAKCAPCHHPGEAAPFSLLTLDDMRSRARQIVDVTQRKLMPPWLPTTSPGTFVG